MTKRSLGFTVIEILFAVVLISAASILFFVQKNDLEIVTRDNTKKTSINAMYYGLEEIFYPTNKYYPHTINSDNLKSVDPALFTDMNGVKLGDVGSLYTYEPTRCINDQCTGYTLKTSLENEADYIKTNRVK